jgi:hypothetical protein
VNCIGIDFQRGTHTRWQVAANDPNGTPTRTDIGASFAIATRGVRTIFIAALRKGSSVWVRMVDEVSGAFIKQKIIADLPANTQLLSPRLCKHSGATVAVVVYYCSRVNASTDCWDNHHPEPSSRTVRMAV